jgi:hypothetical protein
MFTPIAANTTEFSALHGSFAAEDEIPASEGI